MWSLHNFGDFCLMIFLIIVGIGCLHWLGWVQATWDMTDEEKDKLLEYWKEHPSCQWDDDDL